MDCSKFGNGLEKIAKKNALKMRNEKTMLCVINGKTGASLRGIYPALDDSV